MRKILPFFLLFMSSLWGYSQVNLNQSLVAYFPFNGNANDASGNNINGVVNGGAVLTTDRAGQPNAAYYFNGATSYIQLPYSPLYNFAPNDSFTISVRILPDQGYSWPAQALVVKSPFNPNFNASLWNYGTYVLNYRAMTGYAANSVLQGTTVFTGIPCWYNIVATYKNGIWRIYVNGVLEDSDLSQTSFILQDGPASKIAIGKKGDSDGDYYKGKMDDIRIYHRVLNTEEINFLSGCVNLEPCDSWLQTQTAGQSVKVGDLDISGNQITVEAEFNRTAPYTGNYLFAGDLVSKHGTPASINYLLRPNSAEITTGNGYFVTPPICEIDLNKTYHVAMVYDGSTLKFYRNGFLMSQVPATGNLFQNDWLTTIGDYAFGTPVGTNFQGYINEVRIWNVSRTQAQIQTYMNTPLPNPGTQVGLRGYYTFDDLLNKQGNAAYNGVLNGAATINNTNPNCNFIADTCVLIVNTSFTAPDTVCINTPVQVVNTSTGTSNQYWTFCETNFSTTPVATNLGNPGSTLSLPVFTDIVKDDAGNYFAFVINNFPSGISRYDYGSSLLNPPVVTFLGNPGGVLPGNAEGIQVVKANNNWYAIIVGGDPPSGSPSAVAKLSFGASLSNIPVGTNWGNIGNLNYPIDLYLFTENNNWYGYTVNFWSNSITKFNFGADFSAPPTGTNLGNIGGIVSPVGIGEVKNNGSWYLFIVNEAPSSTLSRLDFGNSLNNIPTGINIGNPGGLLNKPRDISFIKLCNEVSALAVNATTNSIIKLDFQNDVTAVPTATSLGNIGNLSFPHSISELFREDNDIYALIPNVNNNTISRIQFAGCSGLPGTSLQNPPPITYTEPGIYNVNLITDIGLPTQSSFCRQIVVQSCRPEISDIINDYTPILAFDPCKNNIIVEDAGQFNVGDTVLIIQMKGALVDTTNTAAFGTVIDYKNSGNYEYNYVKSKTGNIIEFKNKLTRQYDIPNGKVQLIRVPYYQSILVGNTLTALPWDGNKGGVLAFNVRDTVILNADMDVTGKGFKGGNTYNVGDAVLSCFQDAFFMDSASLISSRKGESFTTVGTDKLNGRGPLASGGGGGNGHNSGGGGGGNAGTGGVGGYQLYECNSSFYDNKGLGGQAIPYSVSTNKIFLGGGGGGGHKDGLPTQELSSAGGDGGGIIIVSANYLKSNSHSIIANGAHGKQCDLDGFTCLHDGMGGGGGAGVVMTDIANYLDTHNEKAIGGKGADLILFTPAAGHVAPGGGGGGGLIWYKFSTALPTPTFTNTGGLNGTIVLDANNPFGSMPGEQGLEDYNLVLPIDNALFKPNIDSVRISKTNTTCSSFNFNGLGYTNTDPVATWTWTFGDGGIANTQNTSHTYTGAGTFNVKLVITDINGCKDSIITQVITNTVAANAGLDSAFCGGPASFQLHGVGTGGYSWAPAANLNDNTLQNPTATISSTTTFYLTITDAAGCFGKDSVTITVNTLPVVQTLTDTAICKGSILLLSTTAGNTGYHWSPGTSVSDSLIANPLFTDTLTTTLIVTGINAASCTASDTITVTVKPLPVVNAGKDSLICSTLPLNLNATGASSYEWAPPVFLNNANIPNPVFSGNASTTYFLTGTASNGCKAKDTITITVNSPNSFVQPPNKSFCLNDTVHLDGHNGTLVDYLWNPASNLSSTTSISPVANPPVTTIYTVTVTDHVCNDDSTFNVTVTVNPLPVVRAAKSNDLDCALRNAHLSATGASQYVWSPAGTLTNSTTATPIASPTVNTQYVVTGTDNAGCKNKDSVTVMIGAGINGYAIPNSFTPNGDGLNDCFGIKHWGDARDVYFIIYSRWGEKMFETHDVNICWDGTYKGVPAEGGTYVFYAKAMTPCGEMVKKGNVILIR